MSIRPRFVMLASLFIASAATAYAGSAVAPVTQVLPATAGPVTFASAAIGGGTSTQSVQLLLNQAGTLTISIPSSANGHQEFTVGTVTGCNVNGTTSNAAASTCTVPVTFQPYYAGQRNQPLVVTLNGQVYSFGLTGVGTGPQAHLDTTNLSTIAGASGTTSSTAYTYKTGIPLSPASGTILYEPEGVFTDSSNNIYVTDSGHDLLRVAYQTANAQLACLIVTENPTLFGLAASADTCAGATSQPTVGDVYTIAGTTVAAYNSDNVLATSANISAAGVEVDPAGNVFIGDNGNNRIRVIYQGGANIACLIQIENPTLFGLTSGTGTCTGATSQPTPGFIYTIAGIGGTSAYSGDGGLATAAALYTPNDTAVDSAGDVFMMNFSASATPTIGGRIRVIYNGGAAAAQLITVENPTVITPVVGDIYTIAGSATAEGGDGTLATSSGVGMLSIYCLRIDAYDNLYIADKTYGSTSYGSSTNQARIRVVYNGTVANSNPLASFIALENPGTVASASAVKPGYIYTVAGETGTATQSAATVDGVLATAQHFAGIYGFTFDPAGDIIVTDRLNYTIRRISASTGLINTIAGFPTSASSGTFNASGSAQYVSSGTVTTGVGQMFGPWGISIDSSGGFYFTDYGGNRLRYLASVPSTSYPLLLPTTAVGSTSSIQPFIMTNVGTPGSTLTITADSAPAPFGFLSPANFPGVSECATTSTSTPTTSTITTPVNLSSGTSCSFGLAAVPTNGGVTAGTQSITDNSLNVTGSQQFMNSSITATGVTTVLTTNPTPVTGGNPTQLIATLTTSAAAPVTCGTVTFYITGNPTALGSATLDPVLGTATITTSALAAPTTSITTVYAGSTSGASCSNAAFTPSTAVTVLTVSAKPATTLGLATNNSTPNLNQSIAITATVSSTVSAGSFSGTVTFTNTVGSNTTTIGSVPVNSSGVAVLNISTLPAGTNTIKASYANDLVYANSSTTNSLSITVTAPSYTVTLTSAPGIAVVDGLNGIANFSVATVGGYTGTITVTCGTPLPSYVGCLYSPSSLVFTGANNTLTTQVTVTTQVFTGMNRNYSKTLCALLLPGAAFLMIGFKRRRLLKAWHRGLLLLLCAAFSAVLLNGCGDGVTDATKGTFNVNVTFTDGSTTQVIPVTVTVIGTGGN